MPVRFNKVIKALRKSGVNVERPKKGSHWKARRESDGKMYTIPAHNAEKTELSDEYIKGLCRTFDLDEQQLRAGKDARRQTRG